MKLSSELRETLKIYTALVGATAFILIGSYLKATSPEPSSVIGLLEWGAAFIVVTLVLGGLAFLTEEREG